MIAGLGGLISANIRGSTDRYTVMAGRGPAIHVFGVATSHTSQPIRNFLQPELGEDVDGRATPGHDDEDRASARNRT
jgi:hypothetical protein